jgi:GWxTD domain-containing protein
MKNFFCISICYLLLFTINICPTSAQQDNPGNNRLDRNAFRWDAYFFKSLTNPGQTTIRIYINFPNDILQFVKESNYRFHARYEMGFALFDKQNNQVGGKTVTNDIFVRSFEQTNIRLMTNSSNFSIDLAPGEYNLVMELTDSDTRNALKQSHRLDVRSFSENSLGLSDAIFSNSITTDSTTVENIVPNIGREFASPDAPYGALIYIYPASGDSSISFHYEVKDGVSDQSIIEETHTIQPMSNEPIPQIILLQNRLTKVMPYRLRINVSQADQKQTLTQDFITSWQYFDSIDLTINQSIEPMEHLVKTREWNWVVQANDSTKNVWFNNYWKQRDPTIDTEENELKNEFYLRVSYASKNFTVPGLQKRGWETARGEIYMKYGAPDNIERRASSINNPSFEIWTYNGIQRRFIFEDRSETGDFRLVKVE